MATSSTDKEERSIMQYIVTDPTGVRHHFVFEFEKVFFNEQKYNLLQRWMLDWWWLSLLFAILYIFLAFSGRKLMEKQKKFQLRRALFLWNASLAMFSLWGSLRCVPELIHSLSKHGFQHSICDQSYKEGVTGLWVWLFMASKAPETIDTLFIVLRGQPLIFLHWYHHASVLVYCFYSYAYFASTGRWFVSMNFCIHTIMYTYFALRAAQYRVPKFIQQSITLLQLVQMLMGCIVNFMAFDYNRNRYRCGTSNTNIFLSLILYASYLILFAQFFYTSYLAKSSIKSKDRSD